MDLQKLLPKYKQQPVRNCNGKKHAKRKTIPMVNLSKSVQNLDEKKIKIEKHRKEDRESHFYEDIIYTNV